MHLIHFPWMHPEGAPQAARLGVRFLDPGLGDGRETERFWRPDGLPLDRREAERYVKEALSFGERFQDHKDLEYLRAAGLEDFFSGTSSSLSDELERRLGKKGGAQDPEGVQIRRGQMVLLLNWVLEEKFLEARSGEREYNAMMSELRETLGLEDSLDWSRLGFRDASGSLGDPHSSRWSELLPWFFLFLPRDGVLYTDGEPIRSELRENGAETAPLPEMRGYEELKQFVREQGMDGDLVVDAGWRLALRNRSDPEMPWLDRHYAVFLGRS
jgi:hypothetical protein